MVSIKDVYQLYPGTREFIDGLSSKKFPQWIPPYVYRKDWRIQRQHWLDSIELQKDDIPEIVTYCNLFMEEMQELLSDLLSLGALPWLSEEEYGYKTLQYLCVLAAERWISNGTYDSDDDFWAMFEESIAAHDAQKIATVRCSCGTLVPVIATVPAQLESECIYANWAAAGCHECGQFLKLKSQIGYVEEIE